MQALARARGKKRVRLPICKICFWLTKSKAIHRIGNQASLSNVAYQLHIAKIKACHVKLRIFDTNNSTLRVIFAQYFTVVYAIDLHQLSKLLFNETKIVCSKTASQAYEIIKRLLHMTQLINLDLKGVKRSLKLWCNRLRMFFLKIQIY